MIKGLLSSVPPSSLSLRLMNSARRTLRCCYCLLIAGGVLSGTAHGDEPKRVAAIVTSYYHNSHADMLVSRLLDTDTLDGQGQPSKLKLASIYTDQLSRQGDISRRIAAGHGVPIFD